MEKIKLLQAVLAKGIFACKVSGVATLIATPCISLGQTSLERMLADTTKLVYEINCDSLVAEVRADTRMRLGVDKVSVEQINSRRELEISARSARCSGIAVFSNSETAAISYSYYYDENDEMMIEYSFTSDIL